MPLGLEAATRALAAELQRDAQVVFEEVLQLGIAALEKRLAVRLAEEAL